MRVFFFGGGSFSSEINKKTPGDFAGSFFYGMKSYPVKTRGFYCNETVRKIPMKTNERDRIGSTFLFFVDLILVFKEKHASEIVCLKNIALRGHEIHRVFELRRERFGDGGIFLVPS